MSRFERDRLHQVADEIHRRAVINEVARLGITTSGEDWDALNAAARTPEAQALLTNSMLRCVEFDGAIEFGNILGKRGNRLNSMWATAASERHFASDRSIQPNARQVIIQNDTDFSHVFLIPGRMPFAIGDYHYNIALGEASRENLYREDFIPGTVAYKFGEEAVMPLSEPTAAEMNAALESEVARIAQVPPEEAASV